MKLENRLAKRITKRRKEKGDRKGGKKRGRGGKEELPMYQSLARQKLLQG